MATNNILIGLGGTGGKILRAFKMRMFEEFPSQEERIKQPVSLLYIDSTDEMMPKDGRPRPDFRVMGQDASFTQNEFLNIKSIDVEHILNNIDNYPSVKGIVDNVEVVRKAIGSLGQAAGQKRRAGRLLFAVNAQGYVNAIRNAYARCEQISGSAEHTNIFIFAGLCGGTGSGSIIDAIVQARKTFPEANILVYAMLPEQNLPKADMDQGRYYPNGYAALNELNALQTGRWQPWDVTGFGPAEVFSEKIHGVANGLTLYSNVNENGLRIDSLTELPKLVSDYVYARVFCINDEDQANHDVIRAYNFENMDDFVYEKDETANPDDRGEIRVARTKKINSFGIKRVMYPELRVLKHITYSVGENVLYQFKYNNWRENQGFVNEEKNKDYRKEYFHADNLSAWMLDLDHLTLNIKILESEANYPSFHDYWRDKATGWAEDCKKADCPLNELDDTLADFFANHFREEGVEAYFQGRERIIPELAKEIRRKIETNLFERWKAGDVSIIELLKVSKLLIEKLTEIRADLEAEFVKVKEENQLCDEDRQDNVSEWSRLGILQRMVGKGARLYAAHQDILADLYTSRTQIYAIDFAKKLATRLAMEISKLNDDITAFAQKVNDAIDATEKLIMAQRKVNKGLEDMRGAIIEICEEEQMTEFEKEVCIDKIEMPNIAFQLRSLIVPEGDFVNFGRLANEISVQDITYAFDIKLSEIIKAKHAERAESETRVLGLNILTQLEQKLPFDDKIKEFAAQIVKQSGAFLKLNGDQIQLCLRNNESDFNNPASVNKKVILVSMPSPKKNESQKRFVEKLKAALEGSVSQGGARTDIIVNTNSLREDEITVLTVSYCYPMRAIDWLSGYEARYKKFLSTGNTATDLSNRILLYIEGAGDMLPSLFAKKNAEELAATESANNNIGSIQRDREIVGTTIQQSPSQPQPNSSMPPMPGTMPPPIAQPEKPIKLFIAVAGQQYGPYDRAVCKQLVNNGQLTPDSLVWMEGLPQWMSAKQVTELNSLFAPALPSMPPIPTSGGSTPPPIM